MVTFTKRRETTGLRGPNISHFLANITYVILMCRGNLSLRKKYKFIFFEIFILLVN